MERAAAHHLSFGPPAEGAPPVSMELSQAKRPRPPAEAEQFVGLRAGGWWDMGYEMDGAKGLLVGCVGWISKSKIQKTKQNFGETSKRESPGIANCQATGPCWVLTGTGGRALGGGG
eukprot:scaffold50088_cov32-Tisochrysis_lutea.AAC.6